MPHRQTDARGEAIGRHLSREQLAARASVPASRIDELIEAGILQPDLRGRFVTGDVDRIRILGAFASAGVPLDALARAVDSGAVSFAHYDELHPSAEERSQRTFGALREELGGDSLLLEQLLIAFGLAAPDDDERLSADDEQMLLAAIDVVGAIGPTELALRVARLLGEGARRTGEAALDVYGLAADEVGRQAAGLPGEETYERYLAPWSRLARLAPRLAAWLHARHLSAAIDAYSVEATERLLEAGGFVAPRQVSPPAVAFVDLTGFTRLSEEHGDQAAAAIAMRLAALAEEAARRHGGQVVKLLGDGVLLRFDGAVSAVQSSIDLLSVLSAAGMPNGHVGIDAGPLVVREGDIFGRTVNLASRLSDQADSGEVLVSESVAASLPRDRFQCRTKGRIDLKGIAGPILAFVVVRVTGGEAVPPGVV